jgi:hypothetical protein
MTPAIRFATGCLVSLIFRRTAASEWPPILSGPSMAGHVVAPSHRVQIVPAHQTSIVGQVPDKSSFELVLSPWGQTYDPCHSFATGCLSLIFRRTAASEWPPILSGPSMAGHVVAPSHRVQIVPAHQTSIVGQVPDKSSFELVLSPWGQTYDPCHSFATGCLSLIFRRTAASEWPPILSGPSMAGHVVAPSHRVQIVPAHQTPS